MMTPDMNPDPAVPGWLLSAGLVAGCFFCLLSAIGCLRAKDTYARIHVATKAVAFGGAILVICQMLANPAPTTLVFGVLVIGLFYMTLPLAGHVLGRTVHRRGASREQRRSRT